MVGALLVLTLGDMWTVNKRYLNTDSFSEPQVMEEGLKKTPADETILQDKSLDYRVLNLGNGGSPFNDTSKPDRLSLDHIATASDNPEHFYDPANWAPAHWSCNRQRSNRKPPAGLGSRSRKW